MYGNLIAFLLFPELLKNNLAKLLVLQRHFLIKACGKQKPLNVNSNEGKERKQAKRAKISKVTQYYCEDASDEDGNEKRNEKRKQKTSLASRFQSIFPLVWKRIQIFYKK